jgi:hypothetical protein
MDSCPPHALTAGQRQAPAVNDGHSRRSEQGRRSNRKHARSPSKQSVAGSSPAVPATRERRSAAFPVSLPRLATVPPAPACHSRARTPVAAPALGSDQVVERGRDGGVPTCHDVLVAECGGRRGVPEPLH